MQKHKVVLAVLAAIAATWWLTTASAAPRVPNGAFVRTEDGAVYLIKDDQRYRVPFYPARPDELAPFLVSEKWVIPSLDGGVTIGGRPDWEGQAPVQREGWQVLTDAAGQSATSPFMDSLIKVTVKEMTVAPALPSAASGSRTWTPLTPAGKFVVVLVNVENVGKAAVCCMPNFRLSDSRGRFYRGDTDPDDAPVTQARLTVYPVEHQGYIQPNLPFESVLVYDVPLDASGFLISPER